MPRLRERLDNVENLVDLVKKLVGEIEDGVTVELENTGEGTVWQFLHGEIKTLPVRLKVKP